ncbi:23S rRNA (pseudouridine(1915)-N(3))-methyltransferase RlmH [Halioxenophilus sp. WMMB6]|uniref:23S rRNA (pseudouridine(1915)-N(3))-methyltransferase RlmH n=1 Tax=Halioxenophilus sp. WMMB6 TaxID=3073815 RepID=UPI00295E7AE6|nr:23S rRNA (pseudouridine(1915)-N(3))-methyltransferase RlmH [Halioxenophilus sp. WMMB6]
MRVKLIAVGTKMPAWVEQGWMEYHKRLPREFKLELVELPLGQRSKSASVEKAMAAEGERMLAAIPDGDWVVALEVGGQSWSTEKLAANLADWQMQGKNLSLLVGGPDGLARDCLQRANQQWSLSALTLPHPLVRVVLVEQLYRAVSILNNHPYHK